MFFVNEPLRLRAVGVLVSLCAAVSVCGGISEAQTIQNSYLAITAGYAGDITGGGPSRGETVDASGKWTVVTLSGDPTTIDDNNQAIIAGAPLPWGIYHLVKIGDFVGVLYGDAENGLWTDVPLADDVNDIIRDSFTFTLAPEGGENRAAIITMHRRLTLIRDTVKCEFWFDNLGIRNYQVSVQTFMALQFGGGLIPVDGGIMYSTKTGSVINETELKGSSVPSEIYAFDLLPAYTIVSRAILNGSGATPPERVVFGDAAHFWLALWDEEIVPWYSTTEQSALVLQWKKTVPAGKVTRNLDTTPPPQADIVTYFGLGNATEDFTYPAMLGTQAPFALTYNRADGDPTGSLEPDPITVHGFVFNQQPNVPLQNVALSITLPPALDLDAGESATKFIGTVGGGNEQTVTWQVVPNGVDAGPFEYSVSMVGTPLSPRTISRTINIPAIEDRFFFAGEYEMVSVPFEPNNPDPATTFGLTTDQFTAIKWNPANGTYENLSAIVPGEGFWFRTTSDTDIELQGVDPLPNSTTTPVYINLKKGWNQVGNPYLYALIWGRAKIIENVQQGAIDISTAVSRGLIRSTIYWYDPLAGSYQYSSSADTLLKPWYAYWIRAMKDVTLVLPPVDVIGGSVTASQTSLSLSSADDQLNYSSFRQRRRPAVPGANQEWNVRLAATGTKGKDTLNVLGVAAASSDAYDSADVEKAPPANNIMLSFINSGWGENTGRYVRDIKKPGQYKKWEVEVLSQGTSDKVTLTWGTAALPRGVNLQLVDMATGKSVRMTPGGSYTFNLKADSARRFRVFTNIARSSY